MYDKSVHFPREIVEKKVNQYNILNNYGKNNMNDGKFLNTLNTTLNKLTFSNKPLLEINFTFTNIGTVL